MFQMRKLRPRGVQTLSQGVPPLPLSPEGTAQPCEEGRAPILEQNPRYGKVPTLPEKAAAFLVFIIGCVIALVFGDYK